MSQHKISVGILAVATVIALPLSVQAQGTTKSLQQQFQTDHAYRNRYIAGWAFFWLLVVIGLMVLLRPHQKPESPRQG